MQRIEVKKKKRDDEGNEGRSEGRQADKRHVVRKRTDKVMDARQTGNTLKS